MKLLIALLALIFFNTSVNASPGDTSKPALYHPLANAEMEIAEAVAKAKAENKHVLIQAGGNWCSWCIRFHKMVAADYQLDSMVKANFIVYHLNYSPENYNPKLFEKYGFPQRFGFPVFLVLDGKGNLIHTENSAYLEEGKDYSKEKVMEFLKGWTVKGLDPASYPEKTKGN